MDGRKRLSGSQYKKKAQEKLEREEEVLSKIPKLETFFKQKSTDSTDKPSTLAVSTTREITQEGEGQKYENISSTLEGRLRLYQISILV